MYVDGWWGVLLISFFGNASAFTISLPFPSYRIVFLAEFDVYFNVIQHYKQMKAAPWLFANPNHVKGKTGLSDDSIYIYVFLRLHQINENYNITMMVSDASSLEAQRFYPR